MPPVFIFSSGGPCEIDLKKAKDVCQLGFIVIPVFNWSANCREEFRTKQTALPAAESDKNKSAHEVSKSEHKWSFKEAHCSLNSTSKDLELTPLKVATALKLDIDINPQIIVILSCCKRVKCFKSHNVESNDTKRIRRYSCFHYPPTGTQIGQEVKDLVHQFYCDDNYSRQIYLIKNLKL